MNMSLSYHRWPGSTGCTSTSSGPRMRQRGWCRFCRTDTWQWCWTSPQEVAARIKAQINRPLREKSLWWNSFSRMKLAVNGITLKTLLLLSNLCIVSSVSDFRGTDAQQYATICLFIWHRHSAITRYKQPVEAHAVRKIGFQQLHFS